MNELLAMLITFGVLGIVGVIAWVACKLDDLIYNKKIQKSKKKFPEFYELIKHRNELSDQLCDYIRKKVAIKNKITEKLADLPYLTSAKQIQAECQLTEWREELEVIEEEKIIPLKEKQTEINKQIFALKDKIEFNGGKVY